MARKIRKVKKRERTLGQAIAWGCLVTLSVASTIFLAQVLVPGTTLHNLFLLVRHTSSETMRADPLFQQYAESIQREEALFATPFSLLCGGLAVGWLAPHYATRRRILLSGAAMAFGVLAVALGFTWPVAVIQQNELNKVGGPTYPITAPLDLIVRQIAWGLAWIAVCVGGAWIGLRLRDRSGHKGATPALGTARR